MKKSLIGDAKASGSFLLGRELPIYRLGFGAMRITGPGIWGYPENLKEAQEVLLRALELGVNFIDTADSYGPEVSENLIAETLYPYSSDLVIATKGGLTRQGPNLWAIDGRPEYLQQCVEKSLHRLRLDCIDLYQLHRIDPKVPVEESLGVLRDLQQAGKIRHIGLSEVSIPDIERAQKVVKIASVQNLYNISNRQAEPLIEYCEKHEIAFIPWAPLASGDMTQLSQTLESIAKNREATPAQVALAWLLKRSRVIVPIPGTSSIAHLEENIAAASLKLTDKEFSLLESLSLKH